MSYVTVQSVEDMIKAWQEECADHPALYNQANVLRDRLSAINAVDAYDRGRRDMLNALLSRGPVMSDLVGRLRGVYRIPITDGLGAVGAGEEPDNPNEFVRRFETSPIQREAADEIERLEALLGNYAEAIKRASSIEELRAGFQP